MAGASTSNAEPMITLVSSDHEEFVVPRSVAEEFKIVKILLSDLNATRIPLFNVEGKILRMLIDYAKNHAVLNAMPHVLPWSYVVALHQFDAQFINVDHQTLFSLMLAANYLEIKGLFDLISEKVAKMIKGKSAEQVRELFNIENDITPEEETQIRMQNEIVLPGNGKSRKNLIRPQFQRRRRRRH